MVMDWENMSAGDPAASGSRKLIFAADWAPIRRFESVMADDPAGCYGDVLPLLQSADLRIVNFECTLRGDGPFDLPPPPTPLGCHRAPV